MPPTLLRVENLCKSYPPDREVLRGLGLDVQAGASVAVVGPSGSGKSTLLNLISALDRPDDGRVAIDGQDLADLSPKHLARLRSERIGFVFQLHHLLPQCTVLENVLLPTLAWGRADDDAQRRAEDLLQRVGLGDRYHATPAELSGGQRQRVAVARALINRPALLLADEPTGSLDRETAGQIAELLCDLNREEHTALVVVTHSDELAGHMERRLVLRDGRLGEPPEAS